MSDENLRAEQSNNQQVSSETADPLIGKVVGRHYRILEVLGKGGMATTYKAKHLLLNKIVALKIIHQSVDGKSLMRFQQEAQTVDSLNHPNIAGLREFAYDDLGQPFLVMDYVLGRTLADIIEDEERLDNDTLLDIALQIAQGLSHAHLGNVVHRDIKPSNIMIAINQDGARQVKLLDFGIARFASGDDLQHLTRTGDLIGTPLYMSPEQSQGQKVDARSDIYSLGCVLYELATGRPPFTGTASLEILQSHCTQSPQAPSAVAPRIDKKLNNLILKALAKDPAQRYQNAGEIVVALEEMSGKSWTKNLQRPIIFGPLALAVLVVAGLSAYIALRAPDRHIDAPTAAQQNKASLEQKEHDLRQVLTALENAPRTPNFADQKAWALLCLAVNELQQKHPAAALPHLSEVRTLTKNPDFLSQAIYWQGMGYAQLNEHEKAVSLLQEAATMKREFFYKGIEESKMDGLNAIALGGIYDDLGSELKAVGQLKEAQACYVQAQKIFERNHFKR